MSARIEIKVKEGKRTSGTWKESLGNAWEVGRDEARTTGFGLMISLGIVGGFRRCYFCRVMEKVRWQWSDEQEG